MARHRLPLPILYQDEWLVVVDKPSGLLVHPGPEAPDRDTCLSRVRRQLGHYVYPCHRLDRGTSGALLLALSPEIAKLVFDAFKERRVEKRYWAVARGYVNDTEVLVDHPVEGAVAQSRVRGLEKFLLPYKVSKYPTGRYSLVEVAPLTGRTHQIRRHLRHLNHPIVGDCRHGDTIHNHFLQKLVNWKRLALAAVEIGFDHPVTGARVQVHCPLAWEFQALLERLRVLA